MPTRIPSSTYRLQFNGSFTFLDACASVPYLHALGITDCYASSYLKAVPGSPHGYDVADATRLNPEIGTDDDYRRFVDALRAHGMGQMLDVVPNHMGIARSANRWWQDVLENGLSSPYAAFFDIDWRPLKKELDGKVLLPILGNQYGAVLESQEIELLYDRGVFQVRYGEHLLPLGPRSYAKILSHGLEALAARPGSPDDAENEHAPDHNLQELESIVSALRRLPPRDDSDPEALAERAREKEVVKRRLARLVDADARIRAFVEQNVVLFNGVRGDARSFDLLDDLLGDQAYRLAHWRVAAEEINYRRFFDINELAAIRMEDPQVFREVHQLVFRLLREGAVTALRIDHVDGLYDPAAYLRHWQQWARAELPHALGDRPLFIIVEKILGPDEPLPRDWPVDGTTGYDFACALNNLFVDPANARAFGETYARFIQERIWYDDLVYGMKKLIMHVSMASEINVLGHQLNRFSERNRHFRDFTLGSLIHAIREIIACFPVYRTYITDGPEDPGEYDRAHVMTAVARAKRRNPAVSPLVFDFVRGLLLKQADYIPPEERQEHLRFVMKFQQTTSPVTAKGIEDTALYIYNRLLSLNEVGGSPDHFGMAPAAFHRWLQHRQACWPHALSATSTHDTKRSEDVRARINVLSGMPRTWRLVANRWRRLTKACKLEVDGQLAPDPNEEYLLYQTLIGAWPLEPLTDDQHEQFVARMQGHMIKALREAKVHTSWLNPSEAYEEAIRRFVAAILERNGSNRFLKAFSSFHPLIAQCGMYNSLAQLLVKIAAPGVPDFYQGTELWDFSLVDPDNRRPVDYTLRARLLAELDAEGGPEGPPLHGPSRRDRVGADLQVRPLIEDLVEHRADGRIKLFLMAKALRYRRAHARLFAEGAYLPLDADGTRKDNIFAFARANDERSVIAIVPRLITQVVRDPRLPPLGTEAWGDTSIGLDERAPLAPAASRSDVSCHSLYRNVLTEDLVPARWENGAGRLRMAEVLKRCPVALLEPVQKVIKDDVINDEGRTNEEGRGRLDDEGRMLRHC